MKQKQLLNVLLASAVLTSLALPTWMDSVMLQVVKANGGATTQKAATELAPHNPATWDGDQLKLTFNGELDEESVKDEKGYKFEKHDGTNYVPDNAITITDVTYGTTKVSATATTSATVTDVTYGFVALKLKNLESYTKYRVTITGVKGYGQANAISSNNVATFEVGRLSDSGKTTDNSSGSTIYSWDGPSSSSSSNSSSSTGAAGTTNANETAGKSNTDDKKSMTENTTTPNDQEVKTPSKSVQKRSVQKKSTFTDLKKHKWASASIEFLHAQGIISGTGAGKFSPDAKVTQGQMTTLLQKLFKKQDQGFLKKIVSVLKKNKEMTRQDVMAMLYKAMKANGMTLKPGQPNALKNYADAKRVNKEAKEAISSLLAEGIVASKTKKLNLTQKLTRAETAVYLKRVYDKLNK